MNPHKARQAAETAYTKRLAEAMKAAVAPFIEEARQELKKVRARERTLFAKLKREKLLDEDTIADWEYSGVRDHDPKYDSRELRDVRRELKVLRVKAEDLKQRITSLRVELKPSPQGKTSKEIEIAFDDIPFTFDHVRDQAGYDNLKRKERSR